MKGIAVLMAMAPALCLAADIAGTWRLNLIAFGEETGSAKLDLKVDGKALTGTLNELKVQGSVKAGATLKFVATRTQWR